MKREIKAAIFAIMLPVALFAMPANAQLDVDKGLHLTHVHGAVYDKSGKAVAGAKVELLRNGAAVVTTTTSQDGGFKFDHVAGSFDLRVTEAHFSPATREILVSMELARAVRGQKIFVLMGPAACAESCSEIITSKREFDETVRRNSGHAR